MNTNVCEYIGLSRFLEKWDKGGEFMTYIGEGAPFTWGDNNHSLVDVDSFLRHANDALYLEYGDLCSEANGFLRDIAKVPRHVYIDLES